MRISFKTALIGMSLSWLWQILLFFPFIKIIINILCWQPFFADRSIQIRCNKNTSLAWKLRWLGASLMSRKSADITPYFSFRSAWFAWYEPLVSPGLRLRYCWSSQFTLLIYTSCIFIDLHLQPISPIQWLLSISKEDRDFWMSLNV